MQKLTYVLLILVLGTLGFPLARNRNLTAGTIAGQEDRKQKERPSMDLGINFVGRQFGNT